MGIVGIDDKGNFGPYKGVGDWVDRYLHSVCFQSSYCPLPI